MTELPDDFRTPARRIYLNEARTLWCIVSEIDYEWIIENNWNWGQAGYSSGRGRGTRPRPLYAKRNINTNRTTIWLHRAIMLRAQPISELKQAIKVADHVNGQTLDDRRENLRWLSHSENVKNRVPYFQIPKLTWIWDHLCIDAALQLEEVPF